MLILGSTNICFFWSLRFPVTIVGISSIFHLFQKCIFSLHTYSWSNGLLSGQRPPHDAPHLSSSVSAPRLRHQPGAHDGETPDILFFFHHLSVLLLLFLLPVLSQCHDSAHPLLFIPGDPVPLLTSDQL